MTMMFKYTVKNHVILRAGETAQGFRVSIVLSEDQVLAPRTQVRWLTDTYNSSQPQEDLCL